MAKKNSLLMGVLTALLFPAIAWMVAYYFKTSSFVINKPALPYVLALALNLLLLRFTVKKDLNKTAQGIMLATFVFMVVLFMFKVGAR